MPSRKVFLREDSADALERKKNEQKIFFQTWSFCFAFLKLYYAFYVFLLFLELYVYTQCVVVTIALAKRVFKGAWEKERS